MWARIVDGKIVQTISNPKPLTINNVQYPSSIFTSAWTDEERKVLSILPYEYVGSWVDDMFYTSSESNPIIEENKVVITRIKKARDIDQIKITMKNHVNSILKNYLEQTDWIIIREQDNSTAKPTDLAKWRDDLRIKAKALETSIDSKSDVADLEEITMFTQEMQDAGKIASEFYDWPKNPRESI